MSAIFYIVGVFILQVIWSIVGGVTQRGAQQEISVRGITGVGLNTIKVAEGSATLGEKIGIAVTTILGSLLSIPFMIVSCVLGGLIFFGVELVRSFFG